MARKSKLADELVPVAIPTRLPDEYEVGAWAKLPQWRCKVCGFDTMLGERPMLEHLVNVHNSEPALELLVGRLKFQKAR